MAKFIPYGKQFIDDDDIAAVVDVLKSDWLTQGPAIEAFEQAVAAYHSCRYAVAFSSGTAALHGAYYISSQFSFGKTNAPLKDGEHFDFLLSPITFAASANAGLYCGGKAKFIDISSDTLNIDISQIEEAITEQTRVITAVSYAGLPVDNQAIKNLPQVKENNICLIHDACHAIGAKINNRGIADFADLTILSFHPVKHLCTGEGGMVLTNNYEYYQKLLRFRSHGITKNPAEFINPNQGDWYHEMQELGYNYRLTDMQAALGLSQLNKLDKSIYRRNQIARLYEQQLKSLDWLITPPGYDKSWLDDSSYNDLQTKPANLHSYHLFPIRVAAGIDRQALFDFLRANNIGVQVHYMPVTMHPYYKQESPLGAKRFYEAAISLPMYYGLSDDDICYVVEVLSGFDR